MITHCKRVGSLIVAEYKEHLAYVTKSDRKRGKAKKAARRKKRNRSRGRD
jgi:ribosomal protein S21